MNQIFQNNLKKFYESNDALGYIRATRESLARRFSEALNEEYTPAPSTDEMGSLPALKTPESIGNAAQLEENPERKLVMELTAMSRQCSGEDDVQYNQGVFVCTLRNKQGARDFISWCSNKPEVFGFNLAVKSDNVMDNYEHTASLDEVDGSTEMDYVVTVSIRPGMVQFESINLSDIWDDTKGPEQIQESNGVLVEAKKRHAAVRSAAPMMKCKPGYVWDKKKKACVCVDDDSMQERMNNRAAEIIQEGYAIVEAKTGRHGETIDHGHPDSVTMVSGITKDYGGGVMARTRSGARYKLSVKAMNHRMPSIGEVLNTEHHKKFTNAEELKTPEFKEFK